MSALDVAQRYFDGWNQHDAGFLVATFDPDGTYRDPATAGALSGQAIGAYASSLFTAFPDLSFELAAAPVADADSVTARWIMRGTNTGPFGGGPATGRTIAFRASTSSGYGTVTSHPSRATSTGEGSSSSSACRSSSSRTRWARCPSARV